MDLFSSAPGSYNAPPPSEWRDWMLHRSLTKGGRWTRFTRVDIAWPVLRRQPQAKGRIKRAIKAAWTTGAGGKCASGPWGIYSVRAKPTLQFSWGHSNRTFFDGDRRTIQGADVFEAVCRVMALSVEPDHGDRKPVPRRRPTVRIEGGGVKRWRKPPMSLRHRYQEGASPLTWPGPPPEHPSPNPIPDEEQAALGVMMQRATDDGVMRSKTTA